MMIWVWGGVMVVFLALYVMMILWFMRGWRLFLHSGLGESLPRPVELYPSVDLEKKEILLSVVVAARNESGRMKPLLEALTTQDFGGSFMGSLEVVWVDDESMDGTAALVEAYAKEHPELMFRVMRRNGMDSFPPHKKGAVAMGISVAQGEWILVTDADCVPSPGWCSTMMTCLARNQSIEFVAGPVRLNPCGSIWLRSQAVEYMSLNAIAASSIALGQPIISNGGNMAFRRSTFLRLNPYADNINHPGGDDDLLMHRIALTFGPDSVVFCADPKAMVDTPPMGNLKDLLQQRIRWVSKQSAYPVPWVSAVLMAVWFMQAMIVIGLLGGIVGWGGIAWISLSAWLVKGMMDGLFTQRAARFYGIRAEWWLLVLTHLWYLPYTLYAGLMGYRGQFEWKGRVYRT